MDKNDGLTSLENVDFLGKFKTSIFLAKRKIFIEQIRQNENKRLSRLGCDGNFNA